MVSGRIVGEVLDHAPEDLTLAERFTLTAIAEDARDRDRIASYSDVESLVRRTCLKPGTIRNALSTLTKRALIEPLNTTVHKGGRHQEYRIPKLQAHHRNATIVSLHSEASSH